LLAAIDEEHVDADEAAAERRDAGVAQSHEQHGERSKSLDVRAVRPRGGSTA